MPFTRHSSRCLFALAMISSFHLDASALDQNSNGISDVWESIYPTAAANPALDVDGDGDINLVEGLAWNNPNDADSRLRLEDFTVGTTDVSFNWNQALGLRYRVWESTNLIDWQHQAISFVGEANNNSISESIETNKFYRLKAERSLNSDTDALTNREEHELGTNPEL